MLKKLKSMLILSLLKIIKRKTPLYFLSKHIFCIVLQIQCAYYLKQLQKDCIMLVCKFNKIKIKKIQTMICISTDWTGKQII